MSEDEYVQGILDSMENGPFSPQNLEIKTIQDVKDLHFAGRLCQVCISRPRRDSDPEEPIEGVIKAAPNIYNTPLYTTVELNKVYAFAFMRFVIRMAQRNWLKGKKVLDKTPKDVVSSEDIDEIDPNQMLIFEETNNEEPEMQSSRP